MASYPEAPMRVRQGQCAFHTSAAMPSSQNLELICEEYTARHAKNLNELRSRGYDQSKYKTAAAMKKFQPIYKE